MQTWKFKTTSERGQELRLDQLISLETGLSRRKARSLIKIGGVQINKKRIKVASRIVTNDSEVFVAYDSTLAAPTNHNIPIIFEDDWLLIVNKPAGIASQGTRASDQHDLMAILCRQRPDQKLRLQHRLDQGTSGILIIAKHSLAYLSSQFQTQKVYKTYLVKVSKPMESCTVDLPIGKVQGVVPSIYGCYGNLLNQKTAITDFYPAMPSDTTGLLPGYWAKANPHTGRTHQIRVHLAHLGNPVFGDIFYGGDKSDQLWLHAWKLALKHPVTGEQLSLTAPPTRFFAK